MVARNPKPVPARSSSRISARLKSTKAATATSVAAVTKAKGITKTTAAKSKKIITKEEEIPPAVIAVAKTKATFNKKGKAAPSTEKTVETKSPKKSTKKTVTTTIVQIEQPASTSDELIVPVVSAIHGKESYIPHPGISHLLAINPKLATVIDRHECHMFSDAGLKEQVDPFQALCSGIISQQVSGAAAKSIKAKFIALFNDKGTFPEPGEIIKKDIPTLRSAGLSQRKAEYISGLAEKFHAGELTNDLLLNSTDEVITEKLLEVRGLGLWSIQMFLLFALKRTDVFATGDLGIQKGMAVMAGKDVSKLKYAKEGKSSKWKYMSEEDMLRLSEPFKPYRSILSWYVWRLADTDVEVMKEK